MEKVISPKIIIDPEFSKLIPPQTDDENRGMEQDMLEFGCTDDLAVWEGKDILLDGHHRYPICLKHNIKFKVKYIKLESREAAKAWIIRHQLNAKGRNLNAFQRIQLAVKLEPGLAAKAKEKQLLSLKQGNKKPVLLENSKTGAVNTRKAMADEAKVSEDMYYKGKIIIEKATEDDKEALRSGEVSINEIYLRIKAREAAECSAEALTKQGIKEFLQNAKQPELFPEETKILNDISYALTYFREWPNYLAKINLLGLPEDKREKVTERFLVPVFNSVLTAVKDWLNKSV